MGDFSLSTFHDCERQDSDNDGDGVPLPHRQKRLSLSEMRDLSEAVPDEVADEAGGYQEEGLSDDWAELRPYALEPLDH